MAIQSNDIPLVERGGLPGLGLLARSGGFIGGDETIRAAAIRDARGETRSRVFDLPVRRTLFTDGDNAAAAHWHPMAVATLSAKCRRGIGAGLERTTFDQLRERAWG